MSYANTEKMFNSDDHKLADAIKWGNNDAEQQRWSYSTMMMYEIAEEVENAIEDDVVKVVHCEDCKHRGDKLINGECQCLKLGKWFPSDGYCCFGEPRHGREEKE